MGSTRGKLSLRAAIDSKCKECIADPPDGRMWRHQVEQCTTERCPLFKVRPRVRRGIAAESTESALEQPYKARSRPGHTQGRGKRTPGAGLPPNAFLGAFEGTCTCGARGIGAAATK
jgi:hypothetical protein